MKDGTGDLLKELKEELKDQRKQDEKLQKELQGKLEASMQAYPPAALKGDKALQTAISKQREEIKEALSQIDERALEMDSQLVDAQVEQNTLMKQQQIESREWFKNMLSIEGLREFFGNDFKEKFFEGVEKIKIASQNVGEKIKEMAVSFKDGLKDKASGLVDFITNVLALLGGATALMGFLDGWKNAEKWFGSNADFGDKLAAGLTGILAAFTGMDEEAQKKVAESLAKFFDYIGEFISELFDGVSNIVMGVINGDGGQVMEGVRGIFDAITGVFSDIVGSITSLFGGDGDRVTLKFNEFFNSLYEYGEALFGFVDSLWGLLTGEEGGWAKFKSSFANLGSAALQLVMDTIDALASSVGLGEEFDAFKKFVKVNILDPLFSVLDWVYEKFKDVAEFLGIDLKSPEEKRQEEIAELEEKIANKQKEVDSTGWWEAKRDQVKEEQELARLQAQLAEKKKEGSATTSKQSGPVDSSSGWETTDAAKKKAADTAEAARQRKAAAEDEERAKAGKPAGGDVNQVNQTSTSNQYVQQAPIENKNVGLTAS